MLMGVLIEQTTISVVKDEQEDLDESCYQLSHKTLSNPRQNERSRRTGHQG
jgi:hypothetical protein